MLVRATLSSRAEPRTRMPERVTGNSQKRHSLSGLCAYLHQYLVHARLGYLSIANRNCAFLGLQKFA